VVHIQYTYYTLVLSSYFLLGSNIVRIDWKLYFIFFTVGDMHGIESHLDDTARPQLLDFAGLIS
jgi:hypothetical protein